MLDIRITKDARFMDQKVTPDVLLVISDCVIKFLELRNKKKQEFTVKDIWGFNYFNESIKMVFSKPDVNEETAKSEYDKLIQQPLKMLSYSGVLECKKRGRTNYFYVKDYKILRYISLKEENAFNFMVLYLIKVLESSGLLIYFEEFKYINTKNEFLILKNMYIDSIIKYTNINEKSEASRIFTKVINSYAAHYGIHGTIKGQFSKKKITFSDLRYNRENWRDTDKEKSETRKMHKMRIIKKYNETIKRCFIKNYKIYYENLNG